MRIEMRSRRLVLALSAVVLVVSCSDDGATGGTDTTEHGRAGSIDELDRAVGEDRLNRIGHD